VVQWNGAALTTGYVRLISGTFVTTALVAIVPAADLISVGSATITVNTPGATPSISNSVSVNIVNPPVPTLTSLSHTGGPVGTPAAETLTGAGFTAATTVAINGQTMPSTFVNSTQLTANFPAAALATLGNQSVTVTTPAPGGGTSAAILYTTYISMPNNDIAYNAADGLLYVSVPATAVGGGGNSVVGIDPNTGSTLRTILVGTNPNKLALSTDGTQLFVGIDGAGAVAQVDLTKGKVVNQFSLGGGPGMYNAPYTASYLAAVPGLPNSVAVATAGGISSGSGVTIFDSGVARTGSSAKVGNGPLSFGSSASTLYLNSGYLDALTLSSSGIANVTQLASASYSNSNLLQYDNGALYLSNGQVFNASNGALNGTFYSASTVAANGPVVSDSTLGMAFVAGSSYSNSATIYAFDEKSFNLVGSIPLNGLGTAGYPTNFRKIVRWGQNGLAIAAIPSAFTTNNQIYIVQSPLVKDVSSAPSDLSVSLTAPVAATTGTSVSYAVKVANAGPNDAVGTTFSLSLDPSLIINSIAATQGSCAQGQLVTCDLGSLANGANATVTVNTTPTISGTLAATAFVNSSSADPAVTNNQASANTAVTGSVYGAVPSISTISPNLAQAGALGFTLTVTGTGFNSGSTVMLGTTSLTTTYASSTQLTAAVPANSITSYGWQPVTISNPLPGGGLSSMVPLTIYALVNVPASSILYDTYGQSLFATIPGSATGILGNSVVSINPYTGTAGTPVLVGSQPTVMTESNDGNSLYVSLSGSQSLAQYDLVHQQLAQTITFSGRPATGAATALAPQPGNNSTFVVSFTGNNGIMDITGAIGQFRPNTAASGFYPAFGDAAHLYTYDGYELYRYSVNTNGLTYIDGTTLDGMTAGLQNGFEVKGGLIYGSAGGIANPVTTPPTQIESLPPIDFYGSGDISGGVAEVADPSLQKEFVMQVNTAGTWAYGLVRYDLQTYRPEAGLIMPASASGVESMWTMKRFGQDGLALLSNNSFGVTPAVSQLLLLRGPFVVPQELTTQTAASLVSSSLSSVAAGTGNTILTLTGTNFLPGVAVTWNGSYRTTTVIDSTHVSIAIPANDLSVAGSASLVATNPGAPASKSLTLTIN
jgi:hypothetical protein